MERQTLTLPYPPGVNNLYATVRGHRVLSKAGRQYKRDAAIIAAFHSIFTLATGPVRVSLVLYRPRRAGDIDGPLKICLDSLTGVAWKDDSQIVELHVVRRDDKTNPRVEITLEPAVEPGGQERNG